MGSIANTAQLKDRLRRLELYGIDKSHPSEEPRRAEASILVFHLADVETCDASSVESFAYACLVDHSISSLVPHKFLVKYSRNIRWTVNLDYSPLHN